MKNTEDNIDKLRAAKETLWIAEDYIKAAMNIYFRIEGAPLSHRAQMHRALAMTRKASEALSERTIKMYDKIG